MPLGSAGGTRWQPPHQQSRLVQTLTACGGIACGNGNDIGMCTEPAEVAAEKNWVFVGEGRGGYNKVQTYNYVGEGAGAYQEQEVVNSYGRRIRPICIIVIAIIVIVCAILLALMTGPAFGSAPQEQEENQAVSDAAAAGAPTMYCDQSDDMTAAKKDFCCKAFGLYCKEKAASVGGANSTAAGAAGSNKALTTVMPPASASVATVPPLPPPPPPPPPEKAGGCKGSFGGGCANWGEKNLKQHYSGQLATQCAEMCQKSHDCGGFFYGVIEPFLGTCSLVKSGCTTDNSPNWRYYDCDAGSEASSNGALPPPPTAAGAPLLGLPDASLHAPPVGMPPLAAAPRSAALVEELPQQKPGALAYQVQAPPATLATTTSMQYDCNKDFQAWLAKWSVAKKAWCCRAQGKGCPPSTGGCGPPALALLPGQTLAPGIASTTPCAASQSAAALSTTAAVTTTTRTFNCNEGYANCHGAWSVLKARWCAEHGNMACPNPANPQGVGGLPPAAPAAPQTLPAVAPLPPAAAAAAPQTLPGVVPQLPVAPLSVAPATPAIGMPGVAPMMPSSSLPLA